MKTTDPIDELNLRLKELNKIMTSIIYRNYANNLKATDEERSKIGVLELDISSLEHQLSELLEEEQTCDHIWMPGRVTCGTEVCIKCNEARLKQTEQPQPEQSEGEDELCKYCPLEGLAGCEGSYCEQAKENMYIKQPKSETGDQNKYGWDIIARQAEEDLKQYMTNLLYYAHIEVTHMTGEEFDQWAEEQIEGIDAYFKEVEQPQPDNSLRELEKILDKPMTEKEKQEIGDALKALKPLDKQNKQNLTNEEIDAEFPINNLWSIEDQAIVIGKRKGAKWMRNRINK